MITKYIVGDITQTELKYIAHGVNCQNKMGSGVARALYEKFPSVKEKYHTFCTNTRLSARLGIVQIAPVENDKTIINMFTQLNYGYDGKRYVNYAAISKCFKSLVGQITEPIAIPKIGCGLAGGDWKFVEQLINDTVGDDLEIWVYELEAPKSSGKNDIG
jgi:O-acetyl-ADP-ribose deacetylase (regulator of RNase III)